MTIDTTKEPIWGFTVTVRTDDIRAAPPRPPDPPPAIEPEPPAATPPPARNRLGRFVRRAAP
jgi:hypothetical protein